MALRVVGESEVMRISRCPIYTIAGQVFRGYNLNDYIEDKDAPRLFNSVVSNAPCRVGVDYPGDERPGHSSDF